MSPQVKATKEKINKWDYIEVQSFYNKQKLTHTDNRMLVTRGGGSWRRMKKVNRAKYKASNGD